MWSCSATSGDMLFFSASAAVRNRSTTSSEVFVECVGEVRDGCDFRVPRGLLGGGLSTIASSGPESVIVLSLSEASAFESLSVALSVFSESPSLCWTGEGFAGGLLLPSVGGCLRD